KERKKERKYSRESIGSLSLFLSAFSQRNNL
ncbi:MAG: hypothetical protein ACI9OT_001886, partial [Gammaproteobacteria bacterium]